MAEDKELSQLEAITNPSANDLMYIVSGGNSRKIPYGNVFPKDDYYTKTQMNTALSGKEPTISVTANRALVSDANGKVSASSATSEEVGYLSGVTGAIQTQINGKADENEATPVSVSGNPITITDAANIPCESLSMTIEPIQSGSGTPSPTNVRPITGLTEANAGTHGKNYIDKTQITITGDYLNISGGTTHSNNWGISPYIQIEGGETYTLSGLTGYSPAICWYDSEQNYISGETYGNRGIMTITMPSNAKYVMLSANLSNLDVIQLEKGSSATAYEPYTENTATISFGETVYGGNVDFDSGIVTVTKKSVDLGTLNWRSGSYSRWVSDTVSDIENVTATGLMNAKCDRLEIQTAIDLYTNQSLIGIGLDDNKQFIARLSDMTSTPTGQIVYTLATPTTLTLTPAQLTFLKGYNTVSANGATISLDYQKDNLAGDIKKWVIEHFG